MESIIDSSIITYITSEIIGPENLKTFSIGLKDSPDLKAAKNVAIFLDTIHHELLFTVQDGIDCIRDLIYHLETFDVTTIRASTPMYLLSRKVKSLGIKMVLSGEGADELFGGYGRIFRSAYDYQRTLKYKIGFVPQHGGFFHDLTVYENLEAIGEITIQNLSYREEKINSLISKFELDPIRDIKADYLSGGQKKKLVIALALISDPKILLLDEPFAALDVMTIKTLQEIIVDLQTNNNISVIMCDHQARDLLACVDTAAIIHNGKVVAQGTPTNLIQNIDARKAYFGESFKIS